MSVPPTGVNFTAFWQRFTRHWRSFSRSHWSRGRSPGSQLTLSPFFRASGRIVATASRMSWAGSTSAMMSRTRPASILEMSRIEVMSWRRFSPFSMMIPRYSFCSSVSGPPSPSSIISEYPITLVSGVRSSWLIVARKLDFSRSSSFSRAKLSSSCRFFSWRSR